MGLMEVVGQKVGEAHHRSNVLYQPAPLSDIFASALGSLSKRVGFLRQLMVQIHHFTDGTGLLTILDTLNSGSKIHCKVNPLSPNTKIGRKINLEVAGVQILLKTNQPIKSYRYTTSGLSPA